MHWCSRWVWYCCHCSEHFDNSSKLVTHSAVHNVHQTNDKEICSACAIAYSIHLRDMSKPNETNIKLEIVEVGEDDEYDYDDEDSELEIVQEETEMEEMELTDIFICNYCFVYFTDKISLKVHMKRSHKHLYDIMEQYKCDSCNTSKTYSRGQDIRKHMRIHHDEEVVDLSRFAQKINIQVIKPNEAFMNTSYVCSPCNKYYARKQDIVKHMRNVHNEDNINPTLFKANPLRLKYTTMTRDIYRCEICTDRYLDADHLFKHMDTTHDIKIDSDKIMAQSEQVFGCNFCQEDDFMSLELLKIHCEENHTYQSHIFLCPQCNDIFMYGGNMVKHMKEIHAVHKWTNRDLVKTVVKKGKLALKKGLYYYCNLCTNKFTIQSDIENHLDVAHKASRNEFHLSDESAGTDNSFVCQKCNQNFSSKKYLIRHMMKQHDKDNNTVCFHCNEVFNTLNALWSHIFTKHAMSPPFQCSICHVPLNHKKEVVKHMGDTHRIVLLIEDTEKMGVLKQKSRIYVDGNLRYQCPECTVILNTFSTLKSHMLTHTGEKPIVCDQCNKSFRTVSQLKVHVVSVHDNVRKFGCEYCGHAFACSSNLAQHIRIHTGEKPYVCELCGNRYAQSASLYSHKLTHAQNRCHLCTECGRAFHRVTRLRQHMKIHTGDRPPRSHLCDICQKGFRTNSELKRHQQIHSNVRSYVCETCHAGFTVRKYLLQHYKVHRDPRDEQVSVETITDLGYVV